MRAILSCVMAACAALALGGCGIKGPLYLPDIPAAPAKPTATNDNDHSKAPAAPSATQ